MVPEKDCLKVCLMETLRAVYLVIAKGLSMGSGSEDDSDSVMRTDISNKGPCFVNGLHKNTPTCFQRPSVINLLLTLVGHVVGIKVGLWVGATVGAVGRVVGIIEGLMVGRGVGAVGRL